MFLLPYFFGLLSSVALLLVAPEIPFLTAVLTPVSLIFIVLFAVVTIIKALLLLLRKSDIS